MRFLVGDVRSLQRWALLLSTTTLFISRIHGSTQNRNLTRLYRPHRSLCDVKTNCTIDPPKYKNCASILEKEECQPGGWTWVYCRTPVVNKCYWEDGKCTSVKDRNAVDQTATTCTNINDEMECAEAVDFQLEPPYGKECYWDEESRLCLGDLRGEEKVGFVDLDHLDPEVCKEQKHVQLRFGICDEGQIPTGDRCLASIPMDTINKGMVKNTLYYNALDMLGLSQYIYEYAALKDLAWKTRNFELLKELLTMPIDLYEVAEILHKNLQIMTKTDEELDGAIQMMHEYLNDTNDREITHATKRSGRKLRAFADSPWHVENSMVYAILVSEPLMRVEVIFRGSSTKYDWKKDLAIKMRKMPNPVKELNETLPYIRVHSGFANVLLGSSKNETVKRPMDEILEQVIPLMKNGYRLFVGGHSLGAALATLFAFYASVDEDIIRFGGGPVTVFSYESPKVGDVTFRGSFMFLEERGKLRHARFHVEEDKVPQVPLGGYRHVGVHFHLHKDAPHTLDYPATKSWSQRGETFFQGLMSLPGALRYHSNPEVLRRLKWARNALLQTSLGAEYRVIWGLQPPPNITLSGDSKTLFHAAYYNLTESA